MKSACWCILTVFECVYFNNAVCTVFYGHMHQVIVHVTLLIILLQTAGGGLETKFISPQRSDPSRDAHVRGDLGETCKCQAVGIYMYQGGEDVCKSSNTNTVGCRSRFYFTFGDLRSLWISKKNS